MAIRYEETQGDGGQPLAKVEIDNGDLQAVKTVMEQYSFVDVQAMLRYALVALLESSDNQLYVRNNGNIVAMKVAGNLIDKKKVDK